MANDLFNSDIQVLRQFVAVNVTNSWDTIHPYVNQALDKVLPILSQEMYDKLLADFTANSVNADHLALLKVTRIALAHFAYMLYQPFGSVKVTDRGITQDKDSAMPFEQRAFAQACRKGGYTALNSMMKLLLSKRDIYTQWKDSSTYSDLLSVFIHTTEDFSEYRIISGIETLLALRFSLLHVQKRVIRANISAALYDELAAGIKANNLNPDNLALMAYVKEALAHLALAYALPQLSWEMTAEGLRAETETPIHHSGRKQERAGALDTFAIGEDEKRKGEESLRELRKFLNANASVTKYSGYFNDSTLYESGSPNPELDQSDGGSLWLIRT